MTLTPAHDEKEERRKREAIELCGKNRGPHDYIPIEYSVTESTPTFKIKRVTRLLCRICFCNTRMSYLLDNYPEIKL